MKGYLLMATSIQYNIYNGQLLTCCRCWMIRKFILKFVETPTPCDLVDIVERFNLNLAFPHSFFPHKHPHHMKTHDKVVNSTMTMATGEYTIHLLTQHPLPHTDPI